MFNSSASSWTKYWRERTEIHNGKHQMWTSIVENSILHDGSFTALAICNPGKFPLCQWPVSLMFLAGKAFTWTNVRHTRIRNQLRLRWRRRCQGNETSYLQNFLRKMTKKWARLIPTKTRTHFRKTQHLVRDFGDGYFRQKRLCKFDMVQLNFAIEFLDCNIGVCSSVIHFCVVTK